MSTDNLVDDGTVTLYRVRIRFAAGDGWTVWRRASAAAQDFANQGDAEAAALKCWRLSDGQDAWRDIEVEVVEVSIGVVSVARITPATVFRTVDR